MINAIHDLSEEYIVLSVENKQGNHFKVYRAGDNTTLSYEEALETAKIYSQNNGRQMLVMAVTDTIYPSKAPLKRINYIK